MILNLSACFLDLVKKMSLLTLFYLGVASKCCEICLSALDLTDQ